MTDGFDVNVAAVAGISGSLRPLADDLDGKAGGAPAADAGMATGEMTKQLSVLLLAAGALANGIRANGDNVAAGAGAYRDADDSAGGALRGDR